MPNSKFLFEELFRQCLVAQFESTLTVELRNALEKLSEEQRKKLVNTRIEGCAPLFIACGKGCVEIAEYLIIKCHADTEQRGIGKDYYSEVIATPLWFAAGVANFNILSLLITHKADIDSVANDGTTALMWACYKKSTNVIRYLLDHHANVNKLTWSGETCLMITRSTTLCTMLLDNGADIDLLNPRGETALYRATHNNQSNKVELLVSRGANVLFRTKRGDDALTEASIEGIEEIFTILVNSGHYSNLRIAEGHELIGGAMIKCFLNYSSALRHWRTALEYRGDQQKIMLPPHAAFGNITEFRTLEELNECSLQKMSMTRQALLIYERILGRLHPYTVKLIKSQCVTYLHESMLSKQIQLWTYALESCIQSDGMLGENTAHLVKRIVLLSLSDEYINESELKLQIISILQELTKELTESTNLVQLKPVYIVQQDNFDRIFDAIFDFIFILDLLYEVDTNPNVKSLIGDVIQCYPRNSDGDSLLHLAVVNEKPASDNYTSIVVSKLRLTSLLCECGAQVDSRNSSDVTPLHIVSTRNFFDAKIVDVLLRFGSHVDWRDSDGNTPLVMLRSNTDYSLSEGSYLNLKCLAAAKVKERLHLYEDEIPKIVEDFVRLH